MNKRILKPIMSLVLVMVMAVSTMMVSAVSTSAEATNKNEYNYKITIKTGDMEQAGTSSRIDLFPYDCNGNRMNGMTFYGDKMSAEFGQNGTYVCTYTCENEIDAIGAAISTSRFFDNWNLEYIDIEYKDKNATVTKRFQYNKWLVDSIAYRDPNPEKHCVFPDLKYDFNIQTASGFGTSIDNFSIKVNGTYGSTDWHNVNRIAIDKTGSASFSDIYIGKIKSITVVSENGKDSWYPENIKVTVGGKTTTINGGRWVDGRKEVTLSLDDVSYSLDITTAGHLGTTNGNISVQIHGDKGSTDWHNIDKVAEKRKGRASFLDIDVGTVERILVSNSSSDTWFPENIKVTVGETTTTFICGRWVSNEYFTAFSVTDKIVKFNVKTSKDCFSGTDENVYVYIKFRYDSLEFNLSEIHPKSNAFEMGDNVTFEFSLDRDYGQLESVEFYMIETVSNPMRIYEDGDAFERYAKRKIIWNPIDDWKLESWSIDYDGMSRNLNWDIWIVEWGKISDSIQCELEEDKWVCDYFERKYSLQYKFLK